LTIIRTDKTQIKKQTQHPKHNTKHTRIHITQTHTHTHTHTTHKQKAQTHTYITKANYTHMISQHTLTYNTYAQTCIIRTHKQHTQNLQTPKHYTPYT